MSPMRKPSAVDSIRRAATSPAVQAAAEAPPAAVVPERRPRPEKPVRFTLDLDRERHAFLKRYADDIEARGAAEVMRALLDELRDDPELATRVYTRIWQSS